MNDMRECWEVHWKDYYKILQIDPLAEPEVVKAAYDRLARKYHPDLNKDTTSAGRMKDLNEAFEILNHPEKRNRYYAVYLQKQTGRRIDTVGASSYPPRPKPNETPSKAPNVLWSDRWCAKCNKTLNMKISLVEKKPAYATCPECGTYWDIRPQVHHSTPSYQHRNDDLPPDVKRRLEQFMKMNKKRFR